MLSCQKYLFDLPDDVSYLNCAYMGPLLKQSEAIGQHEIKKRLRPFQYSKDDFFNPVEDLKANFSKLINGDDSQRIALIPAASYGIANAARNVNCSKGQNVLIIGEQFPSNYYTWKQLADEKGATIKIVSAPESPENRTETWNQNILDNIDEQTAVVAMPIVHWADGTLFDLKSIRKRSSEVGAALIIDGTQSIGALPFDMDDVQPDALICGAYKWMFGPYGMGIAYYGPLFDKGTPIEDNWINRKGSEQFENLVNYQSEYKPKAARYAVGENSNFIYVPMLNASIKQLLEWQPTRIQDYCKNLVSPYLSAFQSLGCTVGSESSMAFHLFGIRMPEGIDILKLKTQFEKENVFISIRGNAIRVAPNVYNEKKDMEALLRCLKQAL
ncbi:MAG: selenocysteine lyase/cysteine desulfurase [Saprospiraceae bacterium]|jgi:selenocysteine lyase/cysteine desulfurase